MPEISDEEYQRYVQLLRAASSTHEETVEKTTMALAVAQRMIAAPKPVIDEMAGDLLYLPIDVLRRIDSRLEEYEGTYAASERNPSNTGITFGDVYQEMQAEAGEIYGGYLYRVDEMYSLPVGLSGYVRPMSHVILEQDFDILSVAAIDAYRRIAAIWTDDVLQHSGQDSVSPPARRDAFTRLMSEDDSA